MDRFRSSSVGMNNKYGARESQAKKLGLLESHSPELKEILKKFVTTLQ